MEHIVLLHSMLMRTIHVIRKAYNRPSVFVSSVYEVASLSSEWLVNLLSGPYVVNTIWRLLYPSNNNSDCDKNSINNYYSVLNNVQTNQTNNTLLRITNLFELRDNFMSNTGLFYDFSKILRNGRNVGVVEDKAFVIEKFLREFCETMEAVDVKNTNLLVKQRFKTIF